MGNTINLSNTPAAPSGKQNITWQNDSSGDVSAYPASATATLEGTVALAGDLGGTSSAPQVVSTHLSSPLPVSQGGTGSATAAPNTFLAGPASGTTSGPLAIRALTAADLPSVSSQGGATLGSNTFSGGQTATQFNATPSSANAGVVVIPDADGETSVAIGVSNAANSSFLASITKDGKVNCSVLNGASANLSGAMNAASASITGALSSGSISTGAITATGAINAAGLTSSGTVQGPYIKSTGTVDCTTINGTTANLTNINSSGTASLATLTVGTLSVNGAISIPGGNGITGPNSGQYFSDDNGGDGGWNWSMGSGSALGIRVWAGTPGTTLLAHLQKSGNFSISGAMNVGSSMSVATSLAVGGATVYNPGGGTTIDLASSQYPQFILEATSAGTDQKNWRLIARYSNTCEIQCLNDTCTSESTGIQFVRSGASISQVNFPTGTVDIYNNLTVSGMSTLNNMQLTGAGTATSANAGSASALPSAPAGYWVFQLNGTWIKIPYYNG